MAVVAKWRQIRWRRRTIAASVVQGLVSCAKCGYAFSRTSTRTSARKIHGSVDHEKLLTLVAQRLADGRVLRLIKAMLKAGKQRSRATLSQVKRHLVCKRWTIEMKSFKSPSTIHSRPPSISFHTLRMASLVDRPRRYPKLASSNTGSKIGFPRLSSAC
jgi:hypothetical protein